ncbi:MAG: MATE family efflux transporter [Candidatus Scalindua sp. AMX11]|nr:MAG: MATE family efflux transporter [Candidatus Scalindua sp.]NOG86015.1 MATE family efflux transporter [Planctomycetota bacterium]RZV91356.1 MAG: MATE family efflux transporter [Candidatus Scalindua sp. SCAELEC01]TDE65913.1 MAG: MATE family efflux transporter [Candidatus Scalindua sp. AMX11]GJQ60731.1 MAG: MATE family efflux transporter [Candidatus Scalindua sp.]
MELTEENLNKNIMKLALPVALENLLHMAVFIADILIVGRLGTAPVAAVGLAGALSFIISMIFSALNVGTTALVARSIGAKEKEEAERVAGQSIFLSVILGLIISPLVFFFAEKFLIAMSAEYDVVVLGTPYLKIISSFFILRLIILTGSAIFRGAGDTRTPMVMTLVMNCVNVVFSCLLVFGIGGFPRLEVAGAAWGTSIAYMIGASFIFYKLLNRKSILTIKLKYVVGVRKARIQRMLRISLPAMLDAFLTQIGYLFFMKIVAILGTVALAAHQIALRIEAISFMPSYAFAVTTATLVGQSLGAGKIDLARLSMRRNCLIALTVMGFFALIFLTLAKPMAKLFHPEQDVLALSSLCIMIAALEQPALAIFMVYAGGLRGAGDTLSLMIITVVGTLCFHLPVAYVFGIVLKWGLAGIWFGVALDWIFRSIAVCVIFKLGRWRKIEV